MALELIENNLPCFPTTINVIILSYFYDEVCPQCGELSGDELLNGYGTCLTCAVRYIPRLYLCDWRKDKVLLQTKCRSCSKRLTFGEFMRKERECLECFSGGYLS